MTYKQANELSSCGYGCHIIGAPWISTNPSCPECNKTDEEDGAAGSDPAPKLGDTTVVDAFLSKRAKHRKASKNCNAGNY